MVYVFLDYTLPLIFIVLQKYTFAMDMKFIKNKNKLYSFRTVNVKSTELDNYSDQNSQVLAS